MYNFYYRYRPSTCKKCKEEIYTYTETQDLCIINKHKCPLGLNVSENVSHEQLKEKRKSWDGSQSLPSSITGRAKSETPPRSRQTKSASNLQKDVDFGKEISHSSNSIDAISSQVDNKTETSDRGQKGADKSNVTHSHDKSQEFTVMENEKCSENNIETTAYEENVQHSSSNNQAQGSNDKQIEAHLGNDESSQDKNATCDKDNEKVESRTKESGDVTKDDIQAQTEKNHDDSAREKVKSQKKAKDTDNLDAKADEFENDNSGTSAVLTVSESETIQYDPSILRNLENSPSPEKRKGANLSTIIETQLSSEASETQLQVLKN